MPDLTEKQLSSNTKIVGSDSQGNETNYLSIDSEGRALVSAKVDTEVDVIYSIDYVKNGSSQSLPVNGSSVPVQFTYTPSDLRFVESLNFFIHDSGTADPEDYGSITGPLANGLLIEIKSFGTIYTLCNIQTNADIVSFFSDSPMAPSSGSQFLNNSDSYAGTINFRRPITINPTFGDFVRVTVRDNLSGVSYNRIAVKSWRKLT